MEIKVTTTTKFMLLYMARILVSPPTSFMVAKGVYAEAVARHQRFSTLAISPLQCSLFK
ncbi:hypothetical protein SESBI_50571 [Sesbania bispinosa]|nr:hypothetical protein SESBI_50571 [Sesbania bispinosa]